MNLEHQVCSLELSKELKELGVKQESYYSYINSEFGRIYGKEYENKIILTYSTISNSKDKYSAFTASELIELLPNRITLKEGEPFNSFRLRIEKSFVVEEGLFIIYLINYYCDSTECEGENAWLQRGLLPHNIWDNNFCNALAKTLIHIMNNKYV